MYFTYWSTVLRNTNSESDVTACQEYMVVFALFHRTVFCFIWVITLILIAFICNKTLVHVNRIFCKQLESVDNYVETWQCNYAMRVQVKCTVTHSIKYVTITITIQLNCYLSSKFFNVTPSLIYQVMQRVKMLRSTYYETDKISNNTTSQRRHLHIVTILLKLDGMRH